MHRRNMLFGGAAAACAMRFGEPPGAPTLRGAAAARNIRFGSEVTLPELNSIPGYGDLIARECAIITPGLEAKWGAIEPQDGVFRFASMDRLAAFAVAHGLTLHMHNLIWAVALPPWVVPAIAEGRAADIRARHIATLVRRYQDHVESWDVVNEPADPRWPSGPEGLCTTPWRRALGADYMRRALDAAHSGNPRVRLLINDDDLEYDAPDRQKKRDIYVRLLTALRRQGVPLHGFGLEAHLKPWRPIADAPYRRFLRALAELDLTLYVTELDVCDRTLPPEIDARDAAVAAMTKHYLDLVLDERAVTTVMTWGLGDRTTWMRHDRAGQREDGLAPRPLPYDEALRPKPMRDALMAAFRHAPPR